MIKTYSILAIESSLEEIKKRGYESIDESGLYKLLKNISGMSSGKCFFWLSPVKKEVTND